MVWCGYIAIHIRSKIAGRFGCCRQIHFDSFSPGYYSYIKFKCIFSFLSSPFWFSQYISFFLSLSLSLSLSLWLQTQIRVDVPWIRGYVPILARFSHWIINFNWISTHIPHSTHTEHNNNTPKCGWDREQARQVMKKEELSNRRVATLWWKMLL